MKQLLLVVGVVVGGLYCLLVNHVDQYEVGISWNLVTGQMWVQDSGYHLTAPWALVSRVDTRPQRVCVTSGSHAAFNCKLVQFQTAQWQGFVATEGWRYYWLSNRLSFNIGYREEYRGFHDILRGYAFSARRYPFLSVLEEYERLQ